MDQEKYVRQVAGCLKCSKAKREEVKKELTADIASALESGEESWETIRARMGTPKAAAQEFNENFPESEKKSYKKKRLLTIVGIVVAVLAVLIALAYWTLPKFQTMGDSGAFSEKQVISRAQKVISLLEEDRFDEIMELSNQQMQTVLENGDLLIQAKDAISTNWGAFQSYGNAYTTEATQMGVHVAVVQINASYENVTVTFTISFDENMELAGLYMK